MVRNTRKSYSRNSMSNMRNMNGLPSMYGGMLSKSSKSKGTRKMPMRANTMHGLQEWYEAKFEKLGWMVLAKSCGYDYKIQSYKHGIKDLLKSIEHVMSEYQDPDRRHDLGVLHMNTMVLHDFVMKHM